MSIKNGEKETEVQHAIVNINVEKVVPEESDDLARVRLIQKFLDEHLPGAASIGYVDLGGTETMLEAGDRRCAEAESEAAAKAERAYERHVDRNGYFG